MVFCCKILKQILVSKLSEAFTFLYVTWFINQYCQDALLTTSGLEKKCIIQEQSTVSTIQYVLHVQKKKKKNIQNSSSTFNISEENFSQIPIFSTMSDYKILSRNIEVVLKFKTTESTSYYTVYMGTW